VTCLGMCDMAPVALNGRRPASDLQPADASTFLAGGYPEPRARVYGKPLLTLARVGKVDPGSLADYEAHGGYRGLRKALALSPEAVIEMANESGILGRGGAMFPLGQKWRFARGSKHESKHIIVNADESEANMGRLFVKEGGSPAYVVLMVSDRHATRPQRPPMSMRPMPLLRTRHCDQWLCGRITLAVRGCLMMLLNPCTSESGGWGLSVRRDTFHIIAVFAFPCEPLLNFGPIEFLTPSVADQNGWFERARCR